MFDVDVEPIDPIRLREHIGDDRAGALAELSATSRDAMAGRTVWNVNSTATGGGVAEMLTQLVAYGRGAGVDTRWVVVEGDDAFFAVTKRIHNRLHGGAGDGQPLGDAERPAYDATTQRAAEDLRARVKSDDIVILHDPQTAGLVRAMKDIGARAVWRCHVGADRTSDETSEAWSFLRPYLRDADHLVFSRREHVPDWVPSERVTLVAPAIDPFSVKNAPMDDDVARAVLDRIGLTDAPLNGARPTYRRTDGSEAEITNKADVVHDGPRLGPDDRFVVQVSRWDRLKDMAGVLRGFAEHVVGDPAVEAAGTTRLMLVGPSVAGVSDDPEGREVLDECVDIYGSLSDDARARIMIVSLPMDDVEENAAMVNAIQRRASIVVQKSLAEGFGLTVAEAMWKARPVVASAVGGICDQVTNRSNGVLVRDPSDSAEFGAALRSLLTDPVAAEKCGAAARERVRECFLPDRQLTEWAGVLAAVR